MEHNTDAVSCDSEIHSKDSTDEKHHEGRSSRRSATRAKQEAENEMKVAAGLPLREVHVMMYPMMAYYLVLLRALASLMSLI